MQVNKTVIRLNNKRLMEVQDGAKSFTSNRTIPLSKAAIALLEELLSNAKNPQGFIFADEDGGPITYEAMRYQIKKACKAQMYPTRDSICSAIRLRPTVTTAEQMLRFYQKFSGILTFLLHTTSTSIFTGMPLKRCEVSLAKLHKKCNPLFSRLHKQGH